MKRNICKTCGKDVTGDGDYDGVDIQGNCFFCIAGEPTGCIVLKSARVNKVEGEGQFLCLWNGQYFVSSIYPPINDDNSYTVNTGECYVRCEDLSDMWVLPPV